MESKARTKGGIVGYHRRNQAVEPGAEVMNQAAAAASAAVAKKEWKKHQTGKRREKLRILNKHLDQHPDF